MNVCAENHYWKSTADAASLHFSSTIYSMRVSLLPRLLCVSVVILVVGNHTARAQSLIVGVPSAEVTPKSHLLLAHESQLNWWSQLNERGERTTAWNSFNFGCYGLSENIELCLTSFNIASPASRNVSIAAGFKTVLPLFTNELPEWEVRSIGGLMLPISLDGQGTGI
jgi:hypothetical protein